MRPQALLGLAADLIEAVLRLDAPADQTCGRFFSAHHALGPRDRRALADTAFHVLRRLAVLRHMAREGSGSPSACLAMLAWQGPPATLEAALTPQQQAWRSQALAMPLDAMSPAQRLNLPAWLHTALQDRLGDELPALAAALDQPAPLDLRVNTARARRDAVRASLATEGIESEPTPYAPQGLRVRGKPSLLRCAAWTRGEIDVQDEGSQLVALLLQPRRQETVVDFCAGAGGKTLALAGVMRDTGRVYALDVSDHRLAALKPRLQRLHLTQVHPMRIANESDARLARLHEKVDRVLVDAPCTGLGTLRRQPELKWRVQPGDVAQAAQAQAAILAAAARLLRPGGRLVYATCSLLAQENEDIAQAFAAAHADFHLLPALEVLQQARVEGAAELVEGPWMRLWPHRHQTDGFFAAVWERAR